MAGEPNPEWRIEAAHHILLSHGRAVPALRAATPSVPVGSTLNLNTVRSASSSREDQAAARRH
jgi:beta-glucosidase